METKIFEIVDRSTFIVAMGVRLKTPWASTPEFQLLRQSGYATEDLEQGRFVLLSTLRGGIGRAVCAPYDWGCHTLTTAHDFIAKNWVVLRSSDVIDAEFIRGESAAPKPSERARREAQAIDLTRRAMDAAGGLS